MTATATLTWFARHELRIAWRDWTQMMSGGLTKRERAVTIATLVFIALLHWLGYAVIKTVMIDNLTDNKTALIILTSMLAASFTMMLSQAIEQITRVFYARADLDLILSSPAAARHLFMVRIVAVAIVGTAMTSLLAAPFINMAAWIDGPKWLMGYAVIAAMSMVATAIGVMASIALFQGLGPKRARLTAQIIAAIVGASLLIGMQVAAIMLHGNLSRVSLLTSSAVAQALPDTTHQLWLPAKALFGDIKGAALLMIIGAAALALSALLYAERFASCAISAAGLSDGPVTRTGQHRSFRAWSSVQALRAKEWRLLARDPWLASQTVMQVLYLVPPAFLLWRDMGQNNSVDVILAPVLVMAFGQLAGGLAWLALSGEDATDLVATAPVPANVIMRAKIEAVLTVIVVIAAPLLVGLALVSPYGAAVSVLCLAAASGSAIAIQVWFKAAAKRSQFRRRQTASRAATFAEALSSIFWAVTAGFATAGSWVAGLFVVFAIVTLMTARTISPRDRTTKVSVVKPVAATVAT